MDREVLFEFKDYQVRFHSSRCQIIDAETIFIFLRNSKIIGQDAIRMGLIRVKGEETKN